MINIAMSACCAMTWSKHNDKMRNKPFLSARRKLLGAATSSFFNNSCNATSFDVKGKNNML